jgi:hypothetical protein
MNRSATRQLARRKFGGVHGGGFELVEAAFNAEQTFREQGQGAIEIGAFLVLLDVAEEHFIFPKKGGSFLQGCFHV